MPISSRTPEGDPNYCPICGNNIRIEPSTTPTRDAPCPHCGHLLLFASHTMEFTTCRPLLPKSFEGEVLEAGRERFGAIPPALIRPLLEAVAIIVTQQKLREHVDLDVLLPPAKDWDDFVDQLQQMAGLKTRSGWAQSAIAFLRKQFMRHRSPARNPA
jgi:DNA-directed RNA polymerase subunit RPC12/RpoP